MKKVATIGIVVAIVLFGVTACSVLKAPEEPSGPIEAVPVEIPTEADTQIEEEEEAETETETEAETETEMEASSGEGMIIFQISQEESLVRFELDEDLRGNRITVVGSTNQVSGEIALDAANSSTAQVGVIQINARTLATDSSFRNRAINNKILNTGGFEFIVFTPTAVTGLPDSISVGETVQFTIVGDLAIQNITNEVTFNVEASLASDSQLAGTASAVITREAYKLIIPSVRDVANVEEEVELYIDFVANN
ncbi:MAG: YceI family protein [Chloroflexi bacterium]|nr:YceI family protein [Chloroflexota bacterium]